MGPQPALWVPVLICSHLLVVFWLLKSFLLSRGGQCMTKSRYRTHTARGQKPNESDCQAGSNSNPQATGARPVIDAGKSIDVITHNLEVCSLQKDVEIGGADSDADTSCDDAPISGHLRAAAKSILWQGIGCSYSIHGSTKVVLSDIWGKAYPGQMQALMGPSGAGKSTLMDILAMRKSVGTLKGQLLINGQPATSSFIRDTSYVPQEDTFIPTMTCRETLSFYAAVTLPDAWGAKASRRQRVAEVLSAVGLGQAGQTLVGGTLPGGLNLRGLSGGERRRLSIAAGILAAPSVLFMDEPTSGLDSFAALSVMGHLQHVAQATHQTVICTIHQPRSAIWEMFDRVTLLSSGRLVFHGPCQGMVPWFESLGYMHTKGSESDWVLDLVATGFDKPAHLYGHTLRTGSEIREVAAAFKEQYLKVEGIADPAAAMSAPGRLLSRAPSTHDINNLRLGTMPSCTFFGCLGCMASKVHAAVSTKATGSLRGLSPEGGLRPSYPSGWWRQFSSLVGREIASSTRNPFDVAGRVLTCTWVGLFIGLVFYRMSEGAADSIRNRTNLLFATLQASLLLPYVGISLYTSDKKIYLADTSAKRYRPSAYYAAKVLATSPFLIIATLSYSWIVYGMSGLRPGGVHMVKYGCIITTVFLIASQVLHLCAVVAPNHDATFSLSIAWTVIQIILSSFFVNYSQVALYGITQLRYIVCSYFGMEALVQNEFSGTTISCSSGLDHSLVDLAKAALPNMTLGQQMMLDQLTQPQPGCIISNDAVVTYFEYSRSFASNFGILLGYLGVLHILTYLALLMVARKEKR